MDERGVNASEMAEGVGFEPTVPVRVHTLSRRAQSSTLAPLREVMQTRPPANLNPGILAMTEVCPFAGLSRLAEGVGFEPTVHQRRTTVFETAPINHSGTPPPLF